MNDISTLKQLNITVLSSFGHNGLDWIHSLLDDHPEVILMPAWSFYRTLDSYKNLNKVSLLSYSLFEVSKKFVDFIYKNPTYNVVRRRFISSKIEAIEFHKHLNNFLTTSDIKLLDENLFRGVNYAFCKLHKIPICKKKIIVTQEHVPWHSEKYKQLFNPKFVFIMRDPRAGIAGSWKRQQDNTSLMKMNSLDFDKINLYWTYAYNFFRKNKDSNKIKIMVNEDMHKDLKKEMIQLCNWLSITFTPSCLEETFLGIEWLGESAYLGVDELSEKPPEDFYDSKNVEARWRGRLKKNDIEMIEVMLNKIFLNFGYRVDTQPSYKKTIKSYFKYMFFNLDDQYYSYRLLIPVILIRNFVRRLLVVLSPSAAVKLFRII